MFNVEHRYFEKTGHEITGQFPLDLLGVDVCIAWMKHHFMHETQFDAYWGGGPLAWCPGWLQGADRNRAQTLNTGNHDFVPARDLAGTNGLLLSRTCMENQSFKYMFMDVCGFGYMGVGRL